MLPLLIALLLGTTLARHLNAPLPLLLSAACIGSLSTLLLTRTKRPRKRWMLCFAISASCCFWAYGQIRLPATPHPDHLALPEREAQLSLEIVRVMQPGERYGKPSGIARVLTAPATSRIHPGDQLYFKMKLPTATEPTEESALNLQRGLQIQTTGVLTPIQPLARESESNDFDAYLKDIGVHYRFDRTGELHTIRAPAAFDQFCTAMNARFQETLRLGAPADSELPNVYVAMLLGRKIELTKAQIERYRMTGTMHFFAISGLHIGVIAAVIAQFLLLIRVPQVLRPFIGLPLLYLYVEITGASPSAMRAFQMATFFWLSYALQRQRSPFAALVGSAIFVLMINPNQLWSLGFQLSYTVVASILLFGLPLHERLTRRLHPYRWLPEENWNRRQRVFAWAVDQVLMLFAISFSAWLASTPLSAGLFEFIAPGAILLNMLLVNLVAIAISGGVISLACATALLPSVAEFLNHSAWVVIFLMDHAVIYSAQIPGAILPSEGFPPSLSYATLAAYFATLLWLHHRSERLHSRTAMWLPPLVIISAIAAGLMTLQ
jgi:competence protein ComEC